MNKTTTLLTLLGLLASVPVYGAKVKQKTEPDYTKGEKLDQEAGNDWALGPTGAFGNIWALSVGNTEKTRMIQIRDVTKGSPADGVLEKDDVILGVVSPVVGGKQKPDARFDSDARKALSAAITEAEKKENDGKLVLNIWRKGKTQPATLTLKVMGTFSNSTPWECEKTTALIEAASQSILKRGLFGAADKSDTEHPMGIDGTLDALGLLATGEAKYLPEIQRYARAVGDPKQKYDLFGKGMNAWHGAYTNLFLTEYYLLTKDDYVLPAIREISQTIAMGRSGVGTWSHGMSIPVHNDGKLYGMAAAYGMMNQTSLTCTISLVMAQKCGIDSPEITEAIKMYTSFCRWWADKGTIPYGDHTPTLVHDGNGKNSQAAVLFDLVGDKETANYFTRMALSSYQVREAGHTGHYFASQWGALGAARGGDDAAKSFVGNLRWFTEMERRPDGSSVYQEQLANTPGKYPGWSTTGQRLMQHCLPRKILFITGKGGSSMPPLTTEEIKSSVAAATFDPTGLTAKQLLDALASWSPVVRNQVGEALGRSEDNVVKELIAMLKSPNRYARYGACEGLRYAGRGSEEAIMALLDILNNDNDITLRYYAVVGLRKSQEPSKNDPEAIAAYGKSIASGAAIEKVIPALLKASTVYDPKLDPGRKLQNEIIELLFTNSGIANYTGYMPGGKGVEKVDSAYLIPALKSMLTNPNGRGRSMASSCYPYLSPEQLKALWGDIYYATKYQAPSGEMFATGVRSNGLKLMAEHSVKEGIPVGLDYALRQEGWGNKSRKYGGIPPLLAYGKALESYVPEIDGILEKWQGRPSGSWNDQTIAADFKKQLAEALKQPAPTLISIKPYIDATPNPRASDSEKKK